MELSITLRKMLVRLTRIVILSATAALLTATCSFGSEPKQITFTFVAFERTTPESALTYLRQDRATLEPECISHVINLLREQTTVSTLDVLLGYMDFEEPVAPGVPHDVRGLGPTGGAYPAVDLVARFHSRAISGLKKIIADEDATSLSRIYAAKAYFAVSPKFTAISFIARAAHRALDPKLSKDLTQLAELMVTYCSAEDRDACKGALQHSDTEDDSGRI
jgi:hypothetical protein